MYNTLSNLITYQEYTLPEITKRINTMYCLGQLDDAQREELQKLAVEHLSIETERPEWAEIAQNLAQRVTALEALHAVPDTADYPQWKKWDGISTDYQKGAVVSHNGKLWESVYSGQNVWEPGTLGTESMWVEYTE
ncbi:MAG: hypothetical protein IJX71_04285 [Oscillospiraceae bacterium]|nr:hypothetical protein [Oscillospiraceae bacterium]